MLYDRWLEIARARPDQIALQDLVHGRQWTFQALARAAGQALSAAGQVIFPQATDAEFVIEVLQGWRSGRIICPLEPEQPAPVIECAPPSGIVHLKTTSATGGKPRLVAFTAEHLLADVENIVATMGLRPDWPNVGFISLAHSYGFSNLVLPLLLRGIPLVLGGPPFPEALRRTAARAPAVTLPAVPALWRAWHDADAIPGNVALAISAGAPLPLELEREVYARYGLKIHNFYGSSECGGIAYDAANSPRSDAACVGAPMRNVTVDLGADGCVQIRSAAVAEGYWPDPDPKLGGGVFRTSDMGEIREGLLCLRGRAGDQINVAGRKVSPETIEALLSTHPQVRACLVFGVPNHDAPRGEEIVACVDVESGVDEEGLRQFALSRMPAWQVPRDWWIVDSLRANPRGKLSRAHWRERYLEHQGG